MELLSFEELIRSHLTLAKRPNGNGWWGILCKVCNDHGRKGKRAGFKFEDTTTGYNCFNCGHTALYEHTHTSFSRDMTEVLDAFDIPKDERNQVLFHALQLQGSGTSTTSRKERTTIDPPSLILPPYFTALDPNSNDDLDAYACEYLQHERLISPTEYPFLIGRKSPHPESKKWYARLIIPIYKDNDLIFYFGRDLSGTRVKKYMSPDVPRDNVLYGFNHMFEDIPEPLYVAEGWFDVYRLGGVAVFGNRMTAGQIAWLNRTPRQKVVIPDRFGDGHLLAEQAIELGWGVSTPDIGECKDVNEAMVKYGEVFTRLSIKKHTYTDFEALVRTQTYCKNEPRTGKTTHQPPH